MMWGYGFGGSAMLLMLGGALLFIVLLAALIWAVLRFVTLKTTTPVPPYTNVAPTGPSALDILNQRYARGEIDTTTYEQMRARLETPQRQPTGGV